MAAPSEMEPITMLFTVEEEGGGASLRGGVPVLDGWF